MSLFDKNSKKTERRSSDFSILIIDDDEVIRNLVGNYFKKQGIKDLTLIEDGMAAWEALQTKTYNFIVLDWKLPKLGGLTLFNRIRAMPTHRTTPILVVSGFLEKNDFRLLQEFPCTALVEKPFTEALFQSTADDLLRETDWHLQNMTLIDSILQAVNHDAKKAESLLKQVIEKAPNPIPLAVNASRQLLQAGMPRCAEKILRIILKRDPDCLMAMSELGKALHVQGRHKEALEVLRQASKISPQNIRRLCLIGEIELNLNDTDAARRHFEKALEYDPAHKKATAGLLLVDNVEQTPSLLYQSTPQLVTKSFASMMNTVAITMVRNGAFEKGIEQYQAALMFLYQDHETARVAFNLGLGYLRWGKPGEAMHWFQKSEKLGRNNFNKSANYIRKMLKSGRSVADLDTKNLVEIEEEMISNNQTSNTVQLASPQKDIVTTKIMGDPDKKDKIDSKSSQTGFDAEKVEIDDDSLGLVG